MPLSGAGCKLGWGEPAKARVRASGVVVKTPAFDDAARLLYRHGVRRARLCCAMQGKRIAENNAFEVSLFRAGLAACRTVEARP